MISITANGRSRPRISSKRNYENHCEGRNDSYDEISTRSHSPSRYSRILGRYLKLLSSLNRNLRNSPPSFSRLRRVANIHSTAAIKSIKINKIFRVTGKLPRVYLSILCSSVFSKLQEFNRSRKERLRNIRQRCDLDVVKNFTLLPRPFSSNWFSDTSGKRLIVHCRWRYRISYQFFSVYRVSFLFRFVVLALVEWRDSMCGEVQRSLRHRYSGEKRERSTGRKLFPDCRTRLSRWLDFPKIPISQWTEEKCPEIFNALKPLRTLFTYARLDSVSRFVQIYCRDHFASSLNKSLSRAADIFF